MQTRVIRNPGIETPRLLREGIALHVKELGFLLHVEIHLLQTSIKIWLSPFHPIPASSPFPHSLQQTAVDNTYSISLFNGLGLYLPL